MSKTMPHSVSDAPAYAEVADMFPRPFVEKVRLPPKKPGGEPRMEYFCTWLNPKFGVFYRIPFGSAYGSGGDAASYCNMDEELRLRNASLNRKMVWTLTPEQAAELIARERRRRAAWAELADHFAGIEEHDLKTLQEELLLNDYQIEEARKAIQKTLKLTPQCDGVAHAAAQAKFDKHVEEHGDLAERQRQLKELERERTSLKNKVGLIPTRRRELMLIARDWPLLFQSAEDIERFHPYRLTRSKGA